MWPNFKKWLKTLLLGPETGCQCFCPGCKENLTKNHSYCWDSYEDLVNYVCPCGTYSKWNFDIAPVPILVRHNLIEPVIQNILDKALEAVHETPYVPRMNRSWVNDNGTIKTVRLLTYGDRVKLKPGVDLSTTTIPESYRVDTGRIISMSDKDTGTLALVFWLNYPQCWVPTSYLELVNG